MYALRSYSGWEKYWAEVEMSFFNNGIPLRHQHLFLEEPRKISRQTWECDVITSWERSTGASTGSQRGPSFRPRSLSSSPPHAFRPSWWDEDPPHGSNCSSASCPTHYDTCNPNCDVTKRPSNRRPLFYCVFQRAVTWRWRGTLLYHVLSPTVRQAT